MEFCADFAYDEGTLEAVYSEVCMTLATKSDDSVSQMHISCEDPTTLIRIGGLKIFHMDYDLKKKN